MALSSFALCGRSNGPLCRNPLVPRNSRRDAPGSSLFQISAYQNKVGIQKTRENTVIPTMKIKECEERVRQYLREGTYKQFEASSYDTAWVAMVPAPKAPQKPCFPQCLEWVLENQYDDGSWGGRINLEPSLLKDKLSSTLASVLALKTWNCNDLSIQKGLYFIRSNLSSVFDENLVSPIGFNIIFPGMLASAVDMGLDPLLGEDSIRDILSLRDLELKRDLGLNSQGRDQYLAYAAEGLGSLQLQDWNAIFKYQKKNGSLFNSPSTTAAAFTQTRNDKAFHYLTSLLQKCGSSVPTIYPSEIYSQLCMVDTLQRMGISHYFLDDIQQTLTTIHRLVQERDEEVTSDMITCALAFRLLRMNGFDVSSDLLSPFQEADSFYGSVQGYAGDMRPVIEIYKASQTKIFPNEEVLNKLASWSRSVLQEDTSVKTVEYEQTISQEVEYALKFPLYNGVHPLENKRYIERFKLARLQMLKTSFMPMAGSDVVLELAVNDFNNCQSLYREELNHLERWLEDCKLDQIETVRHNLLTASYISALATFYPFELSDARVYLTKNTMLITYVDDLLDEEGSIEEIEGLLSLFDSSGENNEKRFYSKKAEILYSAIHITITEMATKAFPLQGRDISSHLFEFWSAVCRSSLQAEHHWINKSMPTVKEYKEFGSVTIGLGVAFVPSLYFLHTKVSEEVVRHQDFLNLLALASVCIRLLNDIRTFEKERNEMTLNILSIYMQRDSISLEDAKLEVQKSIGNTTREMLLGVLKKGNAIPKPLREPFWNLCTISHFLYDTADGFSSPEKYISMYDAVIRKPIDGTIIST